MNYRTLTNKELARVAEARKVLLAQHGILLGELWDELLNRLLAPQDNGNEQRLSPLPIIPVADYVRR